MRTSCRHTTHAVQTHAAAASDLLDPAGPWTGNLFQVGKQRSVVNFVKSFNGSLSDKRRGTSHFSWDSCHCKLCTKQAALLAISCEYPSPSHADKVCILCISSEHDYFSSEHD